MFSDLEHRMLPLMDLAGHDFQLHATQPSAFLSWGWNIDQTLSSLGIFPSGNFLCFSQSYCSSKPVHSIRECLSPPCTDCKWVGVATFSKSHSPWPPPLWLAVHLSCKVRSDKLSEFWVFLNSTSLSLKRLTTMYIHNWLSHLIAPSLKDK